MTVPAPSGRASRVTYANLSIVQFKTAPPFSSGYGETSVPPPAKLIRSGALLRRICIARATGAPALMLIYREGRESLAAPRGPPEPSGPWYRATPNQPVGFEAGMTRRYENPALTVDAVWIRSGKVLLVRRGKPPFRGFWAFPGGFVELHETVEEALVRELREETGLSGHPVKIVGVYSGRTGTHGSLRRPWRSWSGAGWESPWATTTPPQLPGSPFTRLARWPSITSRYLADARRLYRSRSQRRGRRRTTVSFRPG